MGGIVPALRLLPHRQRVGDVPGVWGLHVEIDLEIGTMLRTLHHLLRISTRGVYGKKKPVTAGTTRHGQRNGYHDHTSRRTPRNAKTRPSTGTRRGLPSDPKWQL